MIDNEKGAPNDASFFLDKYEKLKLVNMKIYLTSEPYRRLQNAFTNLKAFKVIDVDYIIETCGLDPENSVHLYIINEEIQHAMLEGLNSRKFTGIIYLNSKLSPELLCSIKDTIRSIKPDADCEYVMMDDYDVPKRKDMYHFADEVMFFPMYKKTKIVECKAICPISDK